MARQPRVYVPGVSVHVIQRGTNRAQVFSEQRDYEYFLTFLERAAATHGVDVHGFALMNNHSHLLVTPRSEHALPRTIKLSSACYVQYYNRKYQRTGTIWNGRYRAIPVDDELYWFTCLKYIEHNPVKARIVTNPADYRWSSYRVHALGEPASWLTPHPLYLRLGETAELRQAVYRALCGIL